VEVLEQERAMSEVTLKAAPGREPGSRAAGRLRTFGQVPAVVYGHGITPVPVSVDWRELRAALTTDAGANALINLEVGSDQHLAVVRDMQRHPIRHDVLHIDFQVVSRDEIISMDVPIVLTGENDTIEKTDGATIEQQMHTLTINSKPGSIPNELAVDISGLDVGSTIRVGDLTLPAGVETDVDPDETVVSVMIVQVELPEPGEGDEVEGAEGAEGETAEGAEGEDAPAAEGDAPDASE
jgi:large subunit ribosomal protein L25